ncbi:transcriptional regulator AsnC [Lewinellaceae bacterium SD302]|nr:transcriptional regulator AsnC [Lewinellaceae bacterium SD302]
MPEKHVLDSLDRQILALLMEDAKRPYTDLANQLYVSGGTIHVRMNKLREAGIVKGESLVIDYGKIGYDITSFLGVYLQKSSMYDDVSEQFARIPEIVSAHYTTGVYSVFIKVVCRDTDHLREALAAIQAIDGIQRTETFISLEAAIERPLQLMSKTEMAELNSRKTTKS